MMQRFGEKLRILRKKQGFTQHDLGNLLEVNHRFVGALERGERRPNAVMLLKLSEIFEVSVDVLIKDQLELED